MALNTCTAIVLSDSIEQKPKQLIDKIGSNLYIGNVHAAMNVDLLCQYNITHIVNVTVDKSNFFENKGYVYHRIPIEDQRNEANNLKSMLPDALKFIDENVKMGNNVLIHCNAGTSRSATVLLAYIMYSMKISLKDAYLHVISYRTSNTYTHPNIGFMSKLLIPLENNINGTSSVTTHEYMSQSSNGEFWSGIGCL